MASDENEILLSPEWEYPEFNYDKINRQDHSSKFAHTVEADYEDKGKFVSTADNDKFFVYLEMRSPLDDIKDNIFPNRKCGWKFHVSIDDTDPENIKNGWNLVKEILIRERVYTSKVVPRGYQMAETQRVEKGIQRGKQITIYTAQHLDRQLEAWSRLVNEITRVLAEKGIAPSHRPESDEPIEGSNYVSFRCDGYYDDIELINRPFNGSEWRDQVQQVHPGELERFREAIKINPPIPNQKDNLTWEPPSSISKCCPM